MLFPNDVQTATAYYRKAAEQYEAIIEDCQPVNERNKETVAEAAYRIAEILFLLNDDKKVVAAAEIAWTNGWGEWEQVMIDRLNDCQRSGVATSNILPPPPKHATVASIALFPLNVLPDMVAEGFYNSYLRTSESLDMFHNGHADAKTSQFDYLKLYVAARDALNSMSEIDGIMALAERTLDYVSKATPMDGYAEKLAAYRGQIEAKRNSEAKSDWTALIKELRALRREILFKHPALAFNDTAELWSACAFVRQANRLPRDDDRLSI